jgi:hypothetical protein
VVLKQLFSLQFHLLTSEFQLYKQFPVVMVNSVTLWWLKPVALARQVLSGFLREDEGEVS